MPQCTRYELKEDLGLKLVNDLTANFPNIKIVNIGSSCIYPLNAESPITEESLMTGKLEPTNSPYAMAKLTAIELGNAMKSQYGHSVINLMPTNLYGPNDNFSKTTNYWTVILLTDSTTHLFIVKSSFFKTSAETGLIYLNTNIPSNIVSSEHSYFK